MRTLALLLMLVLSTAAPALAKSDTPPPTDLRGSGR